MPQLPYIFLIFVAFAGFALAGYIRHKKAAGETLVCPFAGGCEKVIYSEYSKFFGIPNEILGMLYYAVIAISYGSLLAFPFLASSKAIFAITALSMAAFLFSLYLTFIQAIVLKNWCSWCLSSAALNTLIFGLAVYGSEFNIVQLLADNHRLVLLAHVLGVILGVGGATFADIFFFKFLGDFHISKKESEVLKTLSQIIWFALAILIVSGIGLYLPEMARFNASDKFLVKVMVVLVILINGALLNLLVSPKLISMSFGGKHEHKPGQLHRLRKLSFALGAVSITSWYSAFFLGMMKVSPVSFSWLLLIYIGIVGAAVIISQFMERYFTRHAPSL